MGLLSFYFSPAGRIGRGRFWLGLIGLIFIEAAFNYWLATAMFGHDVLDPQSGGLAKPARQLSLLIDLIFLFPTFVVLTKRFHDRDKGAVWALPFLLAYAALIAGFIVGVLVMDMPANAADLHPAGVAIALIWLVVLLWIIVELGCLRGVSGSNRYGPDPLAR